MKLNVLSIKIISLILIIAIVVPASFAFMPPKEAEAGGSSCAVVAALAIAAITSAQTAAAITAVPAADIGKAQTADATGASSESHLIQDCVEHEVALFVANLMLKQMTNILVNWINSGFKGPLGSGSLFAQNPGQFFGNLGQQIAGNIIGGDTQNLCSAFNGAVQGALQLNLPNIEASLPYGSFGAGGSYDSSQTFQGLSQCKLDPQLSISLSTNGGAGFATLSNPWGTWLSATQDMDNNPLGAFMDAENNVSDQISDALSLELDKLNWGNGFFSASTCTGSTCVANTPGHTIAAQLDSQLGVPANQLGVADDLDKIFNALGQQLFSSIFSTNGGLLGTNNSNFHSSTNPTLADQVTTAQSAAAAEASTASGQANNIISNTSNNTTPASGPQSSAPNIAKPTSVVASVSCDIAGRPLGDINDGDRTNQTSNPDGTQSYNGLIAGPASATCNPGQTIGPNAWVMLDLRDTFTFGEIRIYQEATPPGTPDSGLHFHVVVLDKNKAVVWTGPSVLQDFQPNPFSYQVADGTLPPLTSGEFIQVQSDTPGLQLRIAEIEVYPAVPPTITLKGSAAIALSTGQTYTEPGFTATDAFGNDLTSSVVVTPASIDTSAAGSYTITYTVTDKNILTATVKRQVTVTAPYTAPQ